MRDYPYMSARVHAKKDKLLDRKDYDDLLKMEPNDIARRLGEGDYQEAIDELGSRYDGVKLVELALARNLSRTLAHLIEIAPERAERVIKMYLRRYDILSLKRLLKWKKSNQKTRIQDLMMPVGLYSLQDLKELSEKSFEEIKSSIRFPDSEIDYQERIKSCETVSQLENCLDQAYYDELSSFADRIRNKRLEEFFRSEIKHQNVKMALRLKKYGLPEEEIREKLIKAENGKTVEKIIEASDFSEALEIVKESELVPKQVSTDLEDIEHEMEVVRLQEALKVFHQDPMGLLPIIGFIVAKIVEVKNLRVLIQAKETGLQNQDTIRKNLVTDHR
ncbi:MAG: V-type ATPase subunit [Candidatus Nanohalobium sp.]